MMGGLPQPKKFGENLNGEIHPKIAFFLFPNGALDGAFVRL